VTVRLLEIEPDIAGFLSDEDCALADRMRLPIHTLSGSETSEELSALFAQEGTLGAIVTEGMLVRQLQVGEHVGIVLLGDGDIVIPLADSQTLLLAGTQVHATPSAELALITEDVLLAIQRWPRIAFHLLERLAQQSERLETQLVITQLPRVGDRLLAVMWLLAERWGHVTPNGTTLPLRLTHQTLGALVGARRPSVSLALRELALRGALIKQGHGWLLIDPPTAASEPLAAPDMAMLVIDERAGSPSPWQLNANEHSTVGSHESSDGILERSQHARMVARADTRRARATVARSRELTEQLRRLVTNGASRHDRP
jgi:CRP-like cAMP-binding protein